MLNRISRLLVLVVMVVGAAAGTRSSTIPIAYFECARDTCYADTVAMCVGRVLDFSVVNRLGIRDAHQVAGWVQVYGSKLRFDQVMRSSPGWPPNVTVPRTYLGVAQDRVLRVVSWPAYHDVHPDHGKSEYHALIAHEIAHLLHVAAVNGRDQDMGPVWFYEGFAVLVAGQYLGHPLPNPNRMREILHSDKRGDYREYGALVRGLAARVPIAELLRRAMRPNFSTYVESVLQRPPSKMESESSRPHE